MADQQLLNLLYDALAHAETAGEAAVGGEDARWIRTKHAPPEGSSAFGPVQITQKLAEDYYDRGKFSKETQSFLRDHYLPMQDLMLQYGGSDMKPGFEDYDYGKTGNFDPELRDEYEQMAKELISHHWKEKGGNVDSFLERWRGKPPEKDYRERFYSRYMQ